MAAPGMAHVRGAVWAQARNAPRTAAKPPLHITQYSPKFSHKETQTSHTLQGSKRRHKKTYRERVRTGGPQIPEKYDTCTYVPLASASIMPLSSSTCTHSRPPCRGHNCPCSRNAGMARGSAGSSRARPACTSGRERPRTCRKSGSTPYTGLACTLRRHCAYTRRTGCTHSSSCRHMPCNSLPSTPPSRRAMGHALQTAMVRVACRPRAYAFDQARLHVARRVRCRKSHHRLHHRLCRCSHRRVCRCNHHICCCRHIHLVHRRLRVVRHRARRLPRGWHPRWIGGTMDWTLAPWIGPRVPPRPTPPLRSQE